MHHICVQSDNFIFKHPEFEGLTCFQSAHHPLAEGLWTFNPTHNHHLNHLTDNESTDEQESEEKYLNHSLRMILGSMYTQRKIRKLQTSSIYCEDVSCLVYIFETAIWDDCNIKSKEDKEDARRWVIYLFPTAYFGISMGAQ